MRMAPLTPPHSLRTTHHPHPHPPFGGSCTVRWWIVTQRNKIKHAPKHIHPSRNIAYLVGNNSWPVCQARKTHPLLLAAPNPCDPSSKTKGSIFSSLFFLCQPRAWGAEGVARLKERRKFFGWSNLSKTHGPGKFRAKTTPLPRYKGGNKRERGGRKRANFSLVDTFYEIFHRNVSLV